MTPWQAQCALADVLEKQIFRGREDAASAAAEVVTTVVQLVEAMIERAEQERRGDLL